MAYFWFIINISSYKL